jgi:hypothetical protein
MEKPQIGRYGSLPHSLSKTEQQSGHDPVEWLDFSPPHIFTKRSAHETSS